MTGDYSKVSKTFGKRFHRKVHCSPYGLNMSVTYSECHLCNQIASSSGLAADSFIVISINARSSS